MAVVRLESVKHHIHYIPQSSKGLRYFLVRHYFFFFYIHFHKTVHIAVIIYMLLLKICILFKFFGIIKELEILFVEGCLFVSTILVLEDDMELNQTITYALKKEGYHVLSAYSCKEAEKFTEKESFHLAILDVNLPDGDGFQFCKWLKAKKQVPVLFVSARDLEEDVLNGYELGADDYVTKPFSMKILLKKVYVILSRKSQGANIYDDGFLKVDFELGTVQRGEHECLLSPTEYRILKKLIENKGKLLTYSILLDSLWDEGVQITDKHTLAVNINRLRKKIETEDHSYISNVYGMGYIWK